jgi:hypothetical protein
MSQEATTPLPLADDGGHEAAAEWIGHEIAGVGEHVDEMLGLGQWPLALLCAESDFAEINLFVPNIPGCICINAHNRKPLTQRRTSTLIHGPPGPLRQH